MAMLFVCDIDTRLYYKVNNKCLRMSTFLSVALCVRRSWVGGKAGLRVRLPLARLCFRLRVRYCILSVALILIEFGLIESSLIELMLTAYRCLLASLSSVG